MRILKRFFATLCVVIVIIFVLYFWFHIDTVKIEGGSVYSDSEIEKSVFAENFPTMHWCSECITNCMA